MADQDKIGDGQLVKENAQVLDKLIAESIKRDEKNET